MMCPLLRNECMKDKCGWWSQSDYGCAIRDIGCTMSKRRD